MQYRFSILLLAFAFGIPGGSLFAQEEGETAPSVLDSESQPVTEAPSEEEEAPGTLIVDDPVVREKGDVLTMPETPAEPAPPRILPRRGLSMNEVERQFGAPLTRHPAVGQPPITRWDYNGFSVFFEHRTVLHAVQKDRPAEIYRRDELLPASAP